MPRRTQASRSTPRPVSSTPPPHVQEGHILWLPKKEDIRDQSLLHDVTLGDDAYDHPVVVLHIEPLAKRVTVYLLTSRNPSGQVQQYRLPIFPSPPNSANGPQLRLDGGDLDKPSYVRIEKAYSVPWAIIRPYRRNKVYRFTKESFATLTRCYGLPTPGPPLFSSLNDIENAIQTTIRQPAQAAQAERARAIQWPDPSQNRFRLASHLQRDGPPPAQTYPSRRFPSQQPTGPVRPPVLLQDPYEDYLRARLAQYEEEEPDIPWRLVFILAGLGIAFLYYPYLFRMGTGLSRGPRACVRWIRGLLTSVRDSLKAIFTPATKAFRFLQALCSSSTYHDALAWVQGSLRPKCQSLVLGLRGALDKWPSPVSFLGTPPEAPDTVFMRDLASRGEEIVRGYGESISGLLDKLPSPSSFPVSLPEVPDGASVKDLASDLASWSEEIVKGYGEKIGGFLQQRK